METSPPASNCARKVSVSLKYKSSDLGSSLNIEINEDYSVLFYHHGGGWRSRRATGCQWLSVVVPHTRCRGWSGKCMLTA